jgi:single-strand DNA-binding protein
MTIYKNKAIIVGNIGQDPEIRTSKKGTEFAVLSVATSEFFKDKEGQSQQKTQWHNIAVYTPHFVELIKKYIKKGDRVYIEGSLSTHVFKDKNDKEKSITQILVKSFGDDFQFENISKPEPVENKE